MAARKTASRKSTGIRSQTAKSGRNRAAKQKAAPKRTTRRKTAAKKKPVRKQARATKKAGKKKPLAKKTSKKKVAKKKTGKKTAKKEAAKKKATAKKHKKVAAKAPKKKTATAGKRRKAHRRSHGDDLDIHGIKPYRTRTGEGYMNEDQQEHFRDILLAWKVELMQEVDRTVHHMQDEASNFPDPNDRATQESEFGLELRTRDRERKLLKKIDQALARIDEGAYGFCEETGEEIGLKRLEARPVATLCVEAQERREVAERQFRDSDDRYR
jgi:DnaK suppressor protein